MSIPNQSYQIVDNEDNSFNFTVDGELSIIQKLLVESVQVRSESVFIIMRSGQTYRIWMWENETLLGATSAADLASKINVIVNNTTSGGGGVSEGDIITGAGNNALVYTNDTFQLTTNSNNLSYNENTHSLLLQDISIGALYFGLSGQTGAYFIGDVTSTANGTAITIIDPAQKISLLGGDVQIQGRIITNIVTPNYGTTYVASINDYHIAFSGETGASGVDLSEASNVVGTTFIISDGDSIGSSSNITIDAGVDNTITWSNITAQTQVINTDGQVVMLQKITNNKWIVII